MPPTIQSGDGDRDKRPPQRPGAERRSEILCRVKYSNTLPDIPFDLKFITYPFETTRFIQYNPTSLERSYRYEVLTEHDLGVHIDLINREIYQGDGYAQLDPADEKLLEEDVLTPQDSKRSKHHAKSVSWLRRSEYISTEQTRFQPQTMEKIEAKVGFNVKKSFNEETLFMDRDSQIKAIEKTFIDNKITIDKHYSKPGVTPVEEMQIFPDFDLWKYPCAQVIFDTDPAPPDKTIAAQIEQMSQAMIRGVMDESGEQFVAYFLPTDETLQQRRKDLTENIPYTDGDSYEYKMAREYNWNVKSKASKGYEENYFLVMRNGCVFYNELETRVRLSKRRARGPNAGGSTRLIVSHRPLAAREHRMLRLREKQLEPPQDEDEEDEEEEEDEEQTEEEQQEQQQKSSSRRSSRSRSKSKSRSKSGSPVPSRNGKSPTGSQRSRSGSGSRAGSAERSHSASRASSRARVPKSRSRSRSQHSDSHRSRSGTPKSRSASPKSRSVSRSRKSRSGSRRSRSGSRKSASGSPKSRSGSGSQRSGSGSPARSGSGSPARSGSGSPARSGSGSPARSGSGSPARSGSGSPAKSGSARSRSGSRASSRSGSGSHAGSKASSRRNSASGNESARSRSKSGSRQGSRSGSASSRSSRQSGSGSE